MINESIDRDLVTFFDRKVVRCMDFIPIYLILCMYYNGIDSKFKNIRKLKNVRISKETCILIG